MNVQLFGNIDNKTYQAPRINLMQKVQEKGATPLTFKETMAQSQNLWDLGFLT